jgi:hypothetical protein
MRIPYLLTAILVSAAASCANHVPEPVGVAPGTPHVTWVLMAGDRDTPNADYVCQSGSQDECVMEASRPGEPVFSDLHIYYHGAGPETRYTGSVRVGYFNTLSTLEPKILVRKNERITNQSVVGIVTSKPGQYDVTFDLVASTTSRDNQPIHQSLPVTVR